MCVNHWHVHCCTGGAIKPNRVKAVNRLLLVAALATTTALAAPAHAVDTYSDLSTWKGAVSSYARDTSYGANLSDIGHVALDGGAEITFGVPLNIRTIAYAWSTEERRVGRGCGRYGVLGGGRIKQT